MSYANIDTERTLEKGESLSARLPEPVGYKILAIKPKIEEQTEGGIIKPQDSLRKEEQGAVVCLVLKLGSLAYKDTTRFPDGPWCKEGDFILLGAYRGSRFAVDGEEFILLNDDMVEGVVTDPRGIGRVW
jgi:co-chaperonin GroES (HSP10)